MPGFASNSPGADAISPGEFPAERHKNSYIEVHLCRFLQSQAASSVPHSSAPPKPHFPRISKSSAKTFSRATFPPRKRISPHFRTISGTGAVPISSAISTISEHTLSLVKAPPVPPAPSPYRLRLQPSLQPSSAAAGLLHLRSAHRLRRDSSVRLSRFWPDPRGARHPSPQAKGASLHNDWLCGAHTPVRCS